MSGLAPPVTCASMKHRCRYSRATSLLLLITGSGCRVAGPPKERLILFDYDASRSSEVAERLLEGCHGYVQSDGYAAYDGVAVRLKLTHVGCMAHSRRR